MISPCVISKGISEGIMNNKKDQLPLELFKIKQYNSNGIFMPL